ncbi:hypothetical protein MTBBW1_850064 [Desulfamplus magnetovallimortis]|uniref:Uncharacterized protein n=1 Tax=Desulfamplus magnetovallimortis TaxID=1246637 RepID=A0A1W1HKW5_9BACT|nr:hypothetical protein [Desulfamplus magnetovallimortis]SLM33076.1 hypothetical protein MTBBW1_850064 [Desulfamplus magnetovallimortis]
MEEAEKRAKEIHAKIREIAAKEAAESLQTELSELKSKQETNSCCNCSCSEKNSMNNFIKYSLAIFIIIIIALVNSSYKNSNTYYICDTKKGLEIWKGEFTPMSKTKIVSLNGLDLPENAKSSYTQLEVFPLPFNYFLDKAEAEIKSGTPYDFEAINGYIQKASEFTVLPEDEELIDAYFKSVALAHNHLNNLKITIPSRSADNEIGAELSEESKIEHNEVIKSQKNNEQIPVDDQEKTEENAKSEHHVMETQEHGHN